MSTEEEFDAEWREYEAVQMEAASKQTSLLWQELELPRPKKKPRTAVMEGFSLHADTHVHENDREALFRLCYCQ